ncbi:hypothetical protein TSUD_300760 [Trifolium subterraneum]|uniref:Uncharacterized protein n=1 Tax=Trifolium subterraneum TaxID=3900 RepID=A0A2Z6PE59_TRISU|nr:hypothetical protein TSUD_300760 [Trifolium subterraneum]
MAENMMKIGEDWKKMNARTNVVFGKIMAKLEILRKQYNFSPSSSHDATNSPKDIPTSEPVNINLLMHEEFCSSTKHIEVPCAQVSLPLPTHGTVANRLLLKETSLSHNMAPNQLLLAPPWKELWWMYSTLKCPSRVRLNDQMSLPPPKSPDFPQMHVEFQVKCNHIMHQPLPKPPNPTSMVNTIVFPFYVATMIRPLCV